eukprot:CAMPEP_0204617062 /NCGR_PEP_ID=MMETSP0717-20131115/4142_1 /ASSEMBLY_ACC=CAM_ASM_000666 /TAXON_ID=230516 /ORGANISM="Chaetoceros curvisetus" /LENGTH=167 /DNA_ID=CAMNT_0051630481 /DNA_START=197 /DNA_END=700 /DNA_ORIENTATION=+
MNVTSGKEKKSILKKELKASEVSTEGEESFSSGSSDTDENDDAESIRVKFQDIKIRNYSMVLGDNPSCTYGPPVSLDWDYDERSAVCIDEYEEKRGRRRKTYQMQIPAVHRRRILEQSGHTEDEMKYTEAEMKKIKKGRERTKMMLPFQKLQEAAENAKANKNPRGK